MTFSNRGGFGSRRGQNFDQRGGGDRGFDRQLFDAVCASCGADCKVPFRPNGRKEVFCSKCFEQNGGGESRDSRGSGRFERRDNVSTYFPDRHMFSAVCDQCGDNCKLPFEPRNGKPVLCSNCFAGKTEGRDSRRSSSESFSRSSAPREGIDLNEINQKLDRILELLKGKEPKKEITEKILEEIEIGTEKKLSPPKKKIVRKTSKKAEA